MGFQSVQTPGQVDALVKSLASKTGAKVTNNVQGTTSLIANNGS